MDTNQQEKFDPESASWLRTMYQTSHSDTRWAKEQAWRVVNWTLVLFFGLLSIAEYVKLSVPLFFISEVFLLAMAIIYLCELHDSARNTRQTSARIENLIPDIKRLLELRTCDKDHKLYLVTQMLVVIGAFVFVALVFMRNN